MSTGNCVEMLNAKFKKHKNICVGLDTENSVIAHGFGENMTTGYERVGIGPRLLRFNQAIIKATHDLAGAYKFNLKFYLAELYQGLYALEQSIVFIKKIAPDVPVILDSKDGDVGISMKKAAEFAFEKLGVDAVTVNPWGGYEDGLDAFFEHKDKMIFVWCRGSNKGSSELQDLEVGIMNYDQFLYELIAERASGYNEYVGHVPEDGWNKFSNCGVVVGATQPEQLIRVRALVGNMPILIPGIGAQSGDLREAVRAAGLQSLFNSSRGLIYASMGEDFAEAARKEMERLNSEIQKYKGEGGVV